MGNQGLGVRGVCSVAGCGRYVKGHGLCGAHYVQRRQGKELRPVVPRLSLVDRFWTNVSRANGCWEWTGKRNRKGYGQIRDREKNRSVHRVSWELHFGNPPPGMLVCHRCDNPPCVRPDHLFLGTARDNMRDCAAKGRAGFQKVSPTDISELVRMRLAGRRIKDLAREFGISRSSVSRLTVRGQ